MPASVYGLQQWDASPEIVAAVACVSQSGEETTTTACHA